MLNVQLIKMFCNYLPFVSMKDSPNTFVFEHQINATLQLKSRILPFLFIGPYDFGGVLTNSNRDIINGDAIHKRNQSHKEMHWYVL